MAEEASEDSEEPGELPSARRTEDAKQDEGRASDLSRWETAASLPGLEVETLLGSELDLDVLPDLESDLHRPEQAWLEERFRGLEPRDLDATFLMYTTGELKPPPGFQDHWRTYDGRGSGLEGLGLTEKDMDTLNVIFMLTDPFNEKECELLKLFLSEVAPFETGPQVVWLFHSNELVASTNERDPKNANGMEQNELLEIFKCGLDGVLVREQRGFALALDVRGLVHSIGHQMRSVGALIAEIRNRPQVSEITKQYIEYILWGYIPGRYAPDLYHQCRFIPREEPEPTFDGLGEQFRNGSFGAWHTLGEPSRKEDGCAEVLRVVDKSALPEISNVVSFSKTVNIISLLSQPEWRHRNILRCLEIIATTNQFYFRFDKGGCQTLRARLEMRASRRKRPRALLAGSVRSIMAQVAAAAAHLHTGPKVVHRDLKPDSYLFHEDAEGRPCVQLVDFELAVRKHDGICGSVCGTAPFAAPEVYTQRSYDGFAADVWSLGVILIEIQCGTDLLHRLLQLPAPSPDVYERLGGLLRAHLGSAEKVQRLLQEYGHLGLSEILPDVEQVAIKVLCVQPGERWSATTVGDVLMAATLKRRRGGEELAVLES